MGIEHVEGVDYLVPVSKEFVESLADFGTACRLKAVFIPGRPGNVLFETQPALDLRQTQREIREWGTRNFGVDGKHVPWEQPFMGLVEELGELAHCVLKQEQSIRGSWEEHEENAKDAVGDFCVYLMDLCGERGWNLEEIIQNTWNKVKQRDWKKDSLAGGEAPLTEFGSPPS